MGSRELTDGEAEACRRQAFEKVSMILTGVDAHLEKLKRADESLTDDAVARMRFTGYKIYFEWVAYCARRSTQHFLPTVETKDSKDATMPDLSQDNSSTLHLGEKTRRMMEFLLKEMEVSPKASKMKAAFERCRAVYEREMRWSCTVASVIKTGEVPYDVPARVAVSGLAKCPKPSEIKYTCDC